MGKKKRKSIKYRDIELNIMPFIDVFSLLNTFLLMSAVFLSVGVLEVQIPFLSNVPPPKDDVRSLDIKVDMSIDKVEVIAAFSRPPIDEKKDTFKLTKEDLTRMHKFLADLRKANPESDKVSFFTDDEVLWKDISRVLDTIKVRLPSDPVFVTKGSEIEKALAAEFLFPKVVMSSVML